jgi:hypothetical protein
MPVSYFISLEHPKAVSDACRIRFTLQIFKNKIGLVYSALGEDHHALRVLVHLLELVQLPRWPLLHLHTPLLRRRNPRLRLDPSSQAC